MAISTNRKRVAVSLLLGTVAGLEAASVLSGRSKTELIEEALQEALGPVFTNPAARDLRHALFLELVAEREGPEEAKELRRIARDNEPARELPFDVQVRLARHRLQQSQEPSE